MGKDPQYGAMEVEGADKGEGGGCCSKIPCCKTCCRRCITCIVCSPIIIICGLLIVILIWGSAVGGQNPLDGSETKATITINMETDDAAATVAALTNTAGTSDRLMAALGGTDLTLRFVEASVGTAKQQGWNVIAEALGTDAHLFIDSATILTLLQTNLANDISTNGVITDVANPTVSNFASIQTEFPVKCVMRGIGGNAISEPLCKSAVQAFLDTQGETVNTEITNALTDYRVNTFGVEDGGNRLFVSATYIGTTFGHTQLQELDCDLTTDINDALDDIREFVDQIPGCDISFEDFNCKVMVNDLIAYRDFDPAVCTTCPGCACVDGLTNLDTSSISAYMDGLQAIETSALTPDFNVGDPIEAFGTVCTTT